MILNHKNFSLNKNKIKIKKKQKFSEDFTFIPINYDFRDLIIQTPILFIPFGKQKYSINDSKSYIDLSFQNMINDKNIEIFFNNLRKLYLTIKEYFNDYLVEDFLKKNKYSYSMRFKIDDECLFFDQNKNIYKNEIKKTFGSFIIHLNGLWVMENRIWFQWYIVQAKINIPIVIKEYIFIDEDDDNKEIKKSFIPPPPPPPPPLFKNNDKYSKMLKLGIPKHAVEQKKRMDRIRPEDLQNVQLKKNNFKKSKIKKNDNSFTPSLDEIRNAKQKLQKII